MTHKTKSNNTIDIEDYVNIIYKYWDKIPTNLENMRQQNNDDLYKALYVLRKSPHWQYKEKEIWKYIIDKEFRIFEKSIDEQIQNKKGIYILNISNIKLEKIYNFNVIKYILYNRKECQYVFDIDVFKNDVINEIINLFDYIDNISKNYDIIDIFEHTKLYRFKIGSNSEFLLHPNKIIKYFKNKKMRYNYNIIKKLRNYDDN